MKPPVKKYIENLVPYPPGKPIEELEREMGISGSIKLASNENPLGPSPLAVKAILEDINKINRYPDGSAYYLKQKLSRIFGLAPSRIIIGNGSNELIELIIRTFLAQREEVIQASPTFLVYEKITVGAGGKIISVPLRDFKIDLEGIAASITPKTRIIIVNNPNNPTGSALSKKGLSDFLINIPDNIIVILDEAYIEFVQNKDIANGLDFLTDHPGVIVLRTFSKIYGLAGLRVGYGFSSEQIIDYMNRVRQPFNVNRLAQVGASAALDDIEFVSATLRLTREGLTYLREKLDGLGLEYLPTETNFLMIKVPLSANEIYEMMLKQGVIIRSMDSYGLKDYIRVNVGLPEENERFISSLKKVLENTKK